ncbi:MAG: glycerol-3-phosphate 1-O-acyltransferase PlsY [Firmicutes bacterium]|nr:glycerol-3-phosphate 1-O-acyltransferase PlsY [Bacillota bacterium]
MIEIALFAVISFVVGSIPFGVITGKLVKNIDIREVGSGNIGAANVWRALGPVPAIIVLILDALKGFACVKLAMMMHAGFYGAGEVISGLSAIMGHNYSVFLKFKGGKGIATSLGVVFGLNAWIALISLGIWVFILLLTRYSSLGSLTGAVAVPVQMYLFHEPPAYLIFAVLAAAFAFYKHKENIKRLIAGREIKINQKVNAGGESNGT